MGILRGGKPGDRVIALRADIDALPVPDACGVDFASTVVDSDYPGGPFPVSLACGHDRHTAMLLGRGHVQLWNDCLRDAPRPNGSRRQSRPMRTVPMIRIA